MSGTTQPIPSRRRILSVYLLITGLRWFAVALPLPLIYLFMGERGMSLSEIGALVSVHALAIVALELPTGGLADAIGRKRVTLIAYALSLIAGGAMLLAFSFPIFAVAWLLTGVARALNSGALDAWFVDSLRAVDAEIDLQPVLAQAASVEIAGLALGTLIGGFLPIPFSFLPSGAEVLLTPLSVTLLASITVQLAALILVALLVQETRPTEGAVPNSLRRVPQLIAEALALSSRNRVIVLLLAATALGAMALSSVETFWQPHFAHWFDPEQNGFLFGLLMTGAFVLGLVGNLAATRLSRLFDRRYALAAATGTLVAAGSLLLLALQAAPLPAALMFLLYYGGLGLGGSPAATLLHGEIPAERRSTMLSVASLAGYLGAAAASLLFGLLAERSGIGTVWLLAAVLLLAGSGSYLAIDHRQRRD